MNWLLISGGAGYVGTLLLKRIVNKYDRVAVLDPCIFGTNGIEKYTNVVIFKRGFKDFQKRISGSKTCAGIIHLGGLSNDPMVDNNPEANMRINVELTKLLTKWAVKNKIKKFLYASSASVYGFNDTKVLTEEDELNPQSAYGRSKVECEKFLEDWEEINPVMVRKGTLMGVSDRMRFDLVVNTLCWYAYFEGKISLFSGGETWRPMVNVKDAAKLYDWLFHHKEYEKFSGQKINLVHKNYRVSELGLFMKSLIENDNKYPKQIEIHSAYAIEEPRSYQISKDKLTKLGFLTYFGLRETVKEIWHNLNDGKYKINDPIYWSARWLDHCKKVCNIIGRKFDPLETYV